jgi:beta-lactamase superfamily II metal-dependent hydrolase
MERFSIGAVLVSPYFGNEPLWLLLKEKLEQRNIPIRIIGEGDGLAQFGLPDSAILHPPKMGFDEQHNSNATSLVLRLEHRGVGMILPGDLDGNVPSPFLLREPMPTEIVMVPHHGGRSRQTDRLIEWTTPKTLIFSTGKLTHKPEMLKELQEKGYEVRSTLLEGAIEIDIGK